MKILIADKFLDSGIKDLELLSCQVNYAPSLKDETLLEEIKKFHPDILIVRSTKVTGDMLDIKSISMVIRAGAGYNTIDVEKASRLGIYVCNCPGKNAIAVAELCMGLILSLDRNIPANTQDLKQGLWNKKKYSEAEGLLGKKLGIIGVGEIGKAVITRAKSFGLEVMAWSRSLTEETAQLLGITYMTSPVALASHADIVSVHLALNNDTREMFDEQFFGAMKEGAFFINTARAEIVKSSALEQAIAEKHIKYATDVWAQEPSGGEGEFLDPIIKSEQVVGTHHIGASTAQAQTSIMNETIRIIKSFLETGRAENCVNIVPHPEFRAHLIVRHNNKVGILAFILNAIKQCNINVLEIENHLFNKEHAACATISVNQIPDEKLLLDLEQNEDVLSIHCIENV